MKNFKYHLIILFVFLAAVPFLVYSQTEISVGKVDNGELDYKGFTLTRDAEITVSGSGVLFDDWDNKRGFYGWILSSDTREVVWHLLKSSKQRKKLRRERIFDFEEKIDLEKGDYEIYYTGVINGSNNIEDFGDLVKKIFGIGNEKNVNRRDRRRLQMLVSGPQSAMIKNDGDQEVDLLSDQAIISLIKVRDEKSLKEGFSLKTDTRLRIFAQGEISDGNFYDYAWIYDAKTNRKVWDINRDNISHAGGGDKNIMVDETIKLPAGSYYVFYVTDNSHSFREWNVFPPNDPQFWGITIWTVNENDRENIELFDERDFESENIIEAIVRVRDDEYRRKSFRLRERTRVRIIAIGEGSRSRMNDYGWIKDNDSGETVWEMKYRRTEHAGGATKNRIFNDTISLQKGDYTVYFETDDSHSYRNWNSEPPTDKDRYGITLLKDNDQ